jgi:hypothetical protein
MSVEWVSFLLQFFWLKLMCYSTMEFSVAKRVHGTLCPLSSAATVVLTILDFLHSAQFARTSLQPSEINSLPLVYLSTCSQFLYF